MKTDITAEISANNFGAGIFEKSGNGIAHNRSVKVANVENLEWIWIGKFTDDSFAREFIGCNIEIVGEAGDRTREGIIV